MAIKVVLEREVHVTTATSETIGMLRIACFEGDDFSTCTCSLPGIDPKDRPNYGSDILHALQLTLEYAIQRIENAKKRGVNVWWVHPEDVGGFRVPIPEEEST